ncbi:hypothetical protein GmHk_04G010378 [Glycine max]|nr:hypothetical protein GmHk_04G010378 [Glycine max]
MSGSGSNSSGGDTTAGSSSSVARSKYKNAPGNRTDIGWKHGIDVDGNGKKVKCKYCSKIVSGGVFRFKHHLAGTREDFEPCATVRDEINLLMMKIVAESKATKEKKRRLNSIYEDEESVGGGGGGAEATNLQGQRGFGSKGKKNNFESIDEKKEKPLVDAQVAEFFYTSAIPFNAIKNLAFLNMCEMIGKYGPGYRPPSYHDVREKLLKQAVQKTDDSLQEFRKEWKRTSCSIIPKGIIFLYSLDTSDISKTIDKVFKMLDDVVKFVGEENVVQVITDNVANFKAPGELLMHTRSHLYWTPCVAHCIDLILEDLEKHLKVHEVTIKKGRKITTYIYGRTMLISMLKKYTNGKDLVRPGMTIFATAYLTLACLHEMKASLMRLFSFEEWKKSKFGTSQEGRKVEDSVLDCRFWKNVSICLKATAPLMVVLRLVDSEQQPPMGFIYVEMDRAKERIKSNFNNVKKNYEPVWEIIDKRWENQLYRPLHATAYYLDPQLHFEDDFRKDNGEVKEGLFICMMRLVKDVGVKNKINGQLLEFHFAKGLFSMENAINSRKTMPPAEWWDMFEDGCPELKWFAIRALSLTCSFYGCEHNWSSFEMVHTKRRNRLHQKKMNDLIYVMYNLKLKSRKTRKTITLPFKDMESDDEWITEERDDIFDEDNLQVDQEQPLGESGCESNIDLVGGSLIDPTLDAFDIDNSVLNDNVEDHFSTEEELEDDGDEDDGGGGDIGDDFIKRLMDI